MLGGPCAAEDLGLAGGTGGAAGQGLWGGTSGGRARSPACAAASSAAAAATAASTCSGTLEVRAGTSGGSRGDLCVHRGTSTLRTLMHIADFIQSTAVRAARPAPRLCLRVISTAAQL